MKWRLFSLVSDWFKLESGSGLLSTNTELPHRRNKPLPESFPSTSTFQNLLQKLINVGANQTIIVSCQKTDDVKVLQYKQASKNTLHIAHVFMAKEARTSDIFCAPSDYEVPFLFSNRFYKSVCDYKACIFMENKRRTCSICIWVNYCWERENYPGYRYYYPRAFD